MPIPWKCVVPDCASLPKDPKHHFPKNAWSAERWRKAVSSPLLENVKTEDLWQ